MEKIVDLDAISIPKAFPLPKLDLEYEWTAYETTPYELIVERAKDATVIITNKCKLDANVLSQLPKLKLISEMATGYNNIDVDYCKEHGIAVTTIQGYSTKSVAEHTLTMMLMLTRSMLTTRKAMEGGLWVNADCFCKLPAPIIDLNGKTITIIGNGAIGTYIGKLCSAFGMRVLKAEHKGAEAVREGYTDFESAIKEADFISVNCPLNAQTANLITKDEIAKMKKSVFIVNNGRGGIVNEQDLVDALKSGAIAGAAADVASTEPLPADHPFAGALTLENFILTPHQAWMSDACLTELVRQYKENVESFFKGERVRRIV